MGKLLNELKRQIKHSDIEIKKNGELCLELYNILETNTGHIWETDWRTLVNVEFEGIYPNNKAIYYPSWLGKIVLNNNK